MSAIFFLCPHCGQQTESDDAFYGQRRQCAHCRRLVEITDANISLPDISAPTTPTTRRCPACGEEILQVARVCKHCQVRLLDPEESRKYDQGVWVSEKSRGIYITLGLLFGLLGVHNFYAGHMLSGLAELIVFGVLSAFWWFSLLSPLSLISLVLYFVAAVFALLVIWEVLTTRRDGHGNIMK